MSAPLYIGLMSGTSLDGVDGVLTAFDGALHAAYVPFPEPLRQALFALQSAGQNEYRAFDGAARSGHRSVIHRA